jgi:hypothetical protein
MTPLYVRPFTDSLLHAANNEAPRRATAGALVTRIQHPCRTPPSVPNSRICTSFTAVEAQKHTYRVHVPTQVGSQIICSAGFLLFSSLPRMHRSIRLNSLRALQRNFQLQNTPGTASPGIYSGVALACWRWGNWRTDDSDFAVRRGFATMATNTNTYKFNHSMYGNLVSKQAGP